MTIPYVTGTVSVTAGSAVVTGAGTAWATALIAGGLFGLDSSNGNPVPILSVDSNTQLTLAKPWRGTTAAGQGYWIVRDTAYLQQQTVNAQALSTYIQRLDNAALTALAALTPGADKLAFFAGGASAALTDFSAFARTLLDDPNAGTFYATLGEVPNAQIPARLRASIESSLNDANDADANGFYSVTGAAANIPEGGIGLILHLQSSPNTATQFYHRVSNGNFWTRSKSSGVWLAWEKSYSTKSAVGPVSQSAGLPTGAIIERGSNANGDYVRFADGTQICWGIPADQVTNQALGNIFRSSAGLTWAYPIAFNTSAPTFAVAAPIQTTNNWCSASPLSSGAGAVIRAFGAITSESIVNIRAAAIGRWF